MDFLRILRIRVAKNGYGRASVPKTVRRVPEVSIADNIIAIEHAASHVAAQFHRDAFRNAGADEIADSGSAEIV